MDERSRTILGAGLVFLGIQIAIISGAATQNAVERIDLPFGPTRLDLDGDDRDDLVMKSWRESHNGNGYTILTFHIDGGAQRRIFPDERARERDPDAPVRTGALWETVMIAGERPGLFDDAVRESDSGHCQLLKAALVRPRLGGPDDDSVLLVIAEKRDYRAVFDYRPVTLSFHVLAADTVGVPGQPRYSFKRLQRIETRGTYCDAAVALSAFLDGTDTEDTPGVSGAQDTADGGDLERIR